MHDFSNVDKFRQVFVLSAAHLANFKAEELASRIAKMTVAAYAVSGLMLKAIIIMMYNNNNI